jgi:hypothetical protein
MALGGLWKSVFARNRAISVPFARLFPTVRLNVGPALGPAGVTPEGLREQVLALAGGRP